MVLIKDFDSVPSGARFFSADLHVHSYGGSPDVSDPEMTPARIVDEAVKQHLSVLAITDHNSMRNTLASIERARIHDGRILVLAATEITTAHGHLLVYFSPEAADALQTLLARIEIVKPGTDESHTSRSMTDVVAEADRLGGVCIAAHIDRKTGFEQFAPGYPNWKKDIINSPLCGLEVADALHIDWYSRDDSSPAAGERRKLLESRNRSHGRPAPLAHIQNSDAHTLNDFVTSTKKRVITRLKMNDLTFDGFRTAFADPDARVRAGSLLPPAIPRVLGLHVDGGFLSGELYRFSDNLNCFIGGRGTGKSTAVRCLAYVLGVDDELEDFDNCPDVVVAYCQDANGVTYRYERMRGSPPTVRARDDENAITEVPVDSFRIEFFGQGALAEVARDPMANPQLFQDFLDRNANLADLFGRERDILSELEQNGSQLRPLQALVGTRDVKKAELDEVVAKLRVAEEGKLRELVALQTRIAAEKTLATGYSEIAELYRHGISLSSYLRDPTRLENMSATRTGTPEVETAFAESRAIIEKANAYLRDEERGIASRLLVFAEQIDLCLQRVRRAHTAKDNEVSEQVAAFQKVGLSASIADLQRHVGRQSQLAKDLGRIEQSAVELEKLCKQRTALLGQLLSVRNDITERRKALVRKLNEGLKAAVDDYIVAIMFQADGITDVFAQFVSDQMRGTYLQEDVVRRVCSLLTPDELVQFVRAQDAPGLSSKAGISMEASQKLCMRLNRQEALHHLETVWKTPRPEIMVRPNAPSSKAIPVKQLSDGQRHTIFLTMAMLADSDAPLVIDQPEDDLDNAFIFTRVVDTLRRVKERRQVIVVTHNANIAVLGDAELLFPMKRVVDRGIAEQRGAIDRKETRDEVQRILEGGEEAFRRRMEIYGH